MSEQTTVGPVSVERLTARNSLFTDRDGRPSPEGCAGSATSRARRPARFRCQPDLALVGVTGPTRRGGSRRELAPAFSSTDTATRTTASFGLLAAPELRTGAEDGSEIGAFSSAQTVLAT